jgi:hypothetical protein
MGVGTSLLTRCLLLKKTRGVAFSVATKGCNWLTGGETENPNVSNSLAGFVCSPLPRREQTWLPTKPASQPHGSPAVSSGMHLVNAPERPLRPNGVQSARGGDTETGSRAAAVSVHRPARKVYPRN